MAFLSVDDPSSIFPLQRQSVSHWVTGVMIVMEIIVVLPAILCRSMLKRRKQYQPSMNIMFSFNPRQLSQHSSASPRDEGGTIPSTCEVKQKSRTKTHQTSDAS